MFQDLHDLVMTILDRFELSYELIGLEWKEVSDSLYRLEYPRDRVAGRSGCRTIGSGIDREEAV